MVHNPSPVSFALPDFVVDWPFEPRLHPDYGIVDLESASWVNNSHLFSQKAQLSFDKSLFGAQSRFCPQILNQCVVFFLKVS